MLQCEFSGCCVWGGRQQIGSAPMTTSQRTPLAHACLLHADDRVDKQVLFDFFDQVAERYADPLYTTPE